MKKFFTLFLFCLGATGCFAQVKDSTRYKLNFKNVAIPAAIITAGLIEVGHDSQELQVLIQKDFPFFGSRLDDVAQYIPLSAVLVAGTLGLKTAHNFKSRLIYSGISYFTVGLTVSLLKKTIHETRPDQSGNNSFPSGHTAFAFTGAEILHQELKADYPVLSYAAYPIATGVGIYRMLNNKHYLSDVLVGAGLGILSAKFAYTVYHPKITNKADKISLSFAPTNILGMNGCIVTVVF